MFAGELTDALIKGLALSVQIGLASPLFGGEGARRAAGDFIKDRSSQALFPTVPGFAASPRASERNGKRGGCARHVGIK